VDGANDGTWFAKLWNPKGHVQDLGVATTMVSYGV